jgi:hypothetical protein
MLVGFLGGFFGRVFWVCFFGSVFYCQPFHQGRTAAHRTGAHRSQAQQICPGEVLLIGVKHYLAMFAFFKYGTVNFGSGPKMQ